MKYLLTIITLASLSTSLAIAQAKIEFDKKVHDFGEVLWKKPATATFTITNIGDKPLVLSNVTTSCGCTVVDWTKSPIQPGSSGTVMSTFDAKMLGRFSKSIGLYTNASNAPIYLNIKGEVTTEIKDFSKTFPYRIGPILMDREEITFEDINRGENPVIELNLVNTSDKPYSPVLMHLPSYLSAKAIPEKIGRNGIGKILITLDTKKLKNLGITTAPLYLARFPGDKVSHENEIPLSVILLPDFTKMSDFAKKNPPKINISSMEVNMGEITPNKKKTYTLLLKNNGFSDLEIRDLQLFNSAIGVQLDKRVIKPKSVTRLKIVVYGRNLEKVKGTPRILMITNDPSNPKIVIKVKTTLKQ